MWVAKSNSVVRVAAGSTEMPFLRMRSKNVATNQLKHFQIANISVLIYEIDVAENDSDNRFRTGSRNNVVSAHVQRKMAKNGYRSTNAF